MTEAGAVTLRKRLSQGGCLAAPGVYDPFSARIVEQLGFDAVYLGGNALGLHLGIGQPFVTLTETVAAVHGIRRVSHPLSIIVDAGAGFGDAAHAALAMEALSAAGATVVHVDDQIYPKRAHYHSGKGRLAGISVVCGKLRAMAEACGRDGPLLVARTDAFRVTADIDATIARCRDYVAAGAAGLMVLDLGPDRMAPFRKEFPGIPFFWIVGLTQIVPSLEELGTAGFAVAVYPFNTIGAVHEAVVATWSGFTTTGRPAPFLRPATEIVADALGTIGLKAALAIERVTTEPDERE